MVRIVVVCRVWFVVVRGVVLFVIGCGVVCGLLVCVVVCSLLVVACCCSGGICLCTLFVLSLFVVVCALLVVVVHFRWSSLVVVVCFVVCCVLCRLRVASCLSCVVRWLPLCVVCLRMLFVVSVYCASFVVRCSLLFVGCYLFVVVRVDVLWFVCCCLMLVVV